MSTTDWQQQPGAPPPGAVRGRNVVKIGVVLVLLAGLAWVIFIAGQYCKTGKPLGDNAGIPNPVANLFPNLSFHYVSAIDGLQNPMGVAIGQDGRVYVTEAGGERMTNVYNKDGQQTGSFAPPDTTPGNRVPVYVAVSPKGDVYVSDRAAAAIYIFSPDGVPEGQVTPPEGPENWHPLGMTFDQAGDLYVADVTPDKHRVVVLNPEGKLKLSFGSQGGADGQFWYPNGIAVDSQGRIYVADSNNGRMQAFDKDGKFLFKINQGMGEADLSMPRGIVIDSENRLLIADTSRGDVQAYEISDSAGIDPNSAPLHFVGTLSGDTGSGALQYPNGLALAGDGKLYMTDRTANRVEIWKY